MSDPFYEDGRLYDLMFPPGPQIEFYVGEALKSSGPVLELACGTGRVLLPIAGEGIECVGLDRSEGMLDEARRKAVDSGLELELLVGDMREFDVGRTFGLVFVASNSLLHLHEAEDLVSCFECVRQHLAPDGRFVFDVFNPSVALLASADGSRELKERFVDPGRGEVEVDVSRIYDTVAQVTRETWFFSSGTERDVRVVPLEVRSIFPQELPLLLRAGGFRLIERFGDFARSAFAAETPHQVCVCEVA